MIAQFNQRTKQFWFWRANWAASRVLLRRRLLPRSTARWGRRVATSVDSAPDASGALRNARALASDLFDCATLECNPAHDNKHASSDSRQLDASSNATNDATSHATNQEVTEITQSRKLCVKKAFVVNACKPQTNKQTKQAKQTLLREKTKNSIQMMYTYLHCFVVLSRNAPAKSRRELIW